MLQVLELLRVGVDPVIPSHVDNIVTFKSTDGKQKDSGVNINSVIPVTKNLTYQADGTTRQFHVAYFFKPNSTEVYWNGQKMVMGIDRDYVEFNNSDIILSSEWTSAPSAEDSFEVIYIQA